jgi:hypothetical protein
MHQVPTRGPRVIRAGQKYVNTLLLFPHLLIALIELGATLGAEGERCLTIAVRN